MRCLHKYAFFCFILVSGFITLPTLKAQDKTEIITRISKLRSLKSSELHDSVSILLKSIVSLDDSEKAEYFRSVYEISGRIREPEIRIEILDQLSLYDKQKYIDYQHELISLAEENNLDNKLFWGLNSLAYFYKSANSLDSAMHYALKARAMVKNESSGENVSVTMLLADLHYWARLYNRAEVLYKEVIELKGDSSQFREWIFVTSNNNLGMIELNRRSFSKAREYFMASLKYRFENPYGKYDSVSIAFIYYLLGKTEYEAGNFVKAREYHETGAPIAEKFDIMEFVFYFSLLDARLLFTEGKTDQSYRELIRAYHLLEKENTDLVGVFESKPQIASDLLTIYDVFINIHSIKGNSDSALYYYKLHQDLAHKLDMSSSYAAYMQMLAEKDNEIMTTLLLQSDKQRKILLTGFFILLVFLLIMLEYNRRIVKIRRKLADKQKELLQTNEYLVSIGDELRQSNAAKDKFFSVLAHDLKNPFSALKGFNELLAETLESKDIPTSKLYADIIRDSTDNIYDLLINLLEWSKIHSGHIVFSPEHIKVESLLNETVLKQRFQAGHKNIALEVIPEPYAVMFCDRYMILTVIRNILSNAIKFTAEYGKISIFYSKEDKNHVITVSDTGMGMSHERVEEVFGIKSKDTIPERKATGDSGLGLIIVKDFLRHHRGSLEVMSEPGKGSKVRIIIPADAQAVAS